MSLRQLCRIHTITAHSSVVTQAKKLKWAEKREAYQARASESFITRHAERMAAREAEIHDKVLEAIDEALDKFRADMWRTEKKLVGGEWVEKPVMLMTPKDLALLIDRLQILFDRPSHINEGRGSTGTAFSEPLPLDAVRQIVDLTRGRIQPATQASPIPRTPRQLDD